MLTMSASFFEFQDAEIPHYESRQGGIQNAGQVRHDENSNQPITKHWAAGLFQSIECGNGYLDGGSLNVIQRKLCRAAADKSSEPCIIIDTQPIFPYFHSMKLFSLFSGSSLSPAWNYSAQHTIWRIMFSGAGHIIGEDRNTEARTVSFFCLDAATGKTLWQHKNFDEQWWIGVDAVHNNRLYLHGFRKPDMPEHKNIYAVDLNTAELVWKNSDCTFIAIQPPYIYGYKDLFERRVYYRLDENTGVFLEEFAALPEDVAPNIQYEKTDFSFARTVTDDGPEALSIARETKEYLSAEYIEQDGFIILNIYSRNHPPAEGLKNTLSVIDTTTKKKVYSDVLNGSTPYPVPDSFFADGNRVYYIKERKTFVALDLKR